ncbi:MAG: putative acyl carrier protein [Mucilaginibacter sp.]|nr:putative acyl carrier protein [Mucilaginibacter sp.]
MDINQFITKFSSQFEDGADIEVTPTTTFRELPTWDSLTAMCIQTMILDDYQVKLSDQDFRSMQTVQEIFDFIENKKK